MKTPDKLDLYKTNKTAYAATRKPALVELKTAVYLGIIGQGAPGGEAFSNAIGALYGMAFTIKMTRKFAGLQDYAVCKLEARYWAEPEKLNWSTLPKDEWRWQMLIRTPEFVTADDLAKARAALAKRGKGAGTEQVELITLDEGLCVQALHAGPYEEEHRTFVLMSDLAESKGLRLHGRHHEIYLSDPRRVAPEKLRTILRHPVTAKT